MITLQVAGAEFVTVSGDGQNANSVIRKQRHLLSTLARYGDELPSDRSAIFLSGDADVSLRDFQLSAESRDQVISWQVAFFDPQIKMFAAAIRLIGGDFRHLKIFAVRLQDHIFQDRRQVARWIQNGLQVIDQWHEVWRNEVAEKNGRSEKVKFSISSGILWTRDFVSIFGRIRYIAARKRPGISRFRRTAILSTSARWHLSPFGLVRF